jgi:Na+/H+ antiporter NhaD/arsenite permease-like protein
MASAVGAAFLLVTRRVKPNKVYTSIDFNLLIVFIGLFVIVAGVEKAA